MSNHSQREMPMIAVMRQAIDVPAELIKHCKDEIAALNLCMNLSNLSDEAIRESLGIDKGHFSRLRKGRLNCDLVDKSKDAQIRELEDQLSLLRRAA